MRFGLIGCGGIGKLRAESLARAKGAELTAVTDLDTARAQSISAKYGGEVMVDWQTMLAREDIEAIVVSTPPALHADMCIKALAADKHVLCEKPLARIPAECTAILQAAQQHNRFIATGFNYRFYPSIQKARELLDSGIIGKLDHIRSYAGYSAAEHNHEWLHDVTMMGGGALRDNGIHLIDLTCYFLGDVAEIKGFASNGVWQFEGCEDNGFALLRNAQGNIASLQASWTEWQGYKLLVEIYGTKGCIRTWCFPMMTQVVWFDKPDDKPKKKRFLFPMIHIMEHLRSYEWVVTQSFVQEIQAFVETLQGKVTPLATGQDGARAIEVAHAATHPKAETKAHSTVGITEMRR